MKRNRAVGDKKAHCEKLPRKGLTDGDNPSFRPTFMRIRIDVRYAYETCEQKYVNKEPVCEEYSLSQFKAIFLNPFSND